MSTPLGLHWVGIVGIVAASTAFCRLIDPSPGTNLALLARVTVSSNDGTLVSAKGAADGDIWNVGFRTELEHNPWVMLDLGVERALSRFIVYGCYDRYPFPAIRPQVETSLDAVQARLRFDCRQENEIPLLIEVSRDGTAYSEVARQEQRFELWNVEVPRQTARYVRLRLLRVGRLQLREIEVY